EPGEGRGGGLVFLNACNTAEAGSFLQAFYHLGMSGLIATEHQTIDTFACPFGLDFLDAFLAKGETVGSAWQRLGARVPLGLLYGAYCPPDIRVVPAEGPGGQGGVAIEEGPRLEGQALGPALQAPPELPPLPARPYRSLQYFDRQDRALFVGRGGDVRRVARLVGGGGTGVLGGEHRAGGGLREVLRGG